MMAVAGCSTTATVASESFPDHMVLKPRRMSVTSNGPRRRYTRRSKPDMNAPQRPLSGYMKFTKDRRRLYERYGWGFAKLAKQIGQDWRQLSTHEKNRYLDSATQDKREFNTATRTYQRTTAYHDYLKYVEEFNQRHNTSPAHDRETSPEQSPQPSDADETSHLTDLLPTPPPQSLAAPAHTPSSLQQLALCPDNTMPMNHPLGTVDPSVLSNPVSSASPYLGDAGLAPAFDPSYADATDMDFAAYEHAMLMAQLDAGNLCLAKHQPAMDSINDLIHCISHIEHANVSTGSPDDARRSSATFMYDCDTMKPRVDQGR